MKERIIETLKKRDELQKEILELIGYGSNDDSYIQMSDEYWYISNDNIMFIDNVLDPIVALEEGEYYSYTISSYSAKGKKLFMKRLDDITIVMAYQDDDSYYNTKIYILDNKNEIID
jgi:hypothetical protein